MSPTQGPRCAGRVAERAARWRPGRSQGGEVLRLLGQECGGFAEGPRVVYMQIATHAGCKDCDSIYLVTFGRKKSWGKVAGGQ